MTHLPLPAPSDPSARPPDPPAPAPGRDRRRFVRSARLFAVAVDALQIVAVPFFLPGAASPVNNVLDVVAAVVLTRLLGWHIAFLPTFVVELIPVVDLFPTWTVAVFVVTRGGKGAPAPPRGQR